MLYGAVLYHYAMYIESVPNRDSPPAILLRESYREGGKVRKRTLLNLSDWPPERIAGFKTLLKGGPVIPKAQNTSASPETVGPGWRKPGGRTPIIVTGSLSSRRIRPTTFGSAP